MRVTYTVSIAGKLNQADYHNALQAAGISVVTVIGSKSPGTPAGYIDKDITVIVEQSDSTDYQAQINYEAKQITIP